MSINLNQLQGEIKMPAKTPKLDKMVATVSRKTNVNPKDVKRVLNASFPSIRKHIVRELGLRQDKLKKAIGEIAL
jgi:hypothetical protein